MNRGCSVRDSDTGLPCGKPTVHCPSCGEATDTCKNHLLYDNGITSCDACWKPEMAVCA